MNDRRSSGCHFVLCVVRVRMAGFWHFGYRESVLNKQKSYAYALLVRGNGCNLHCVFCFLLGVRRGVAMTATLSQLLSSQEARDAAPCVAYQPGKWRLLRSGALIRPGVDEHYWNPDGTCKHGRECDIIWSGDLVAELAAVDALRAALTEVLSAARGFASAVRQDTGMEYPWPAMEIAEADARQALKGPDA